MKYRKLGASDLMVSEISLGSWLTYGVGVERDKAAACVDRAFELGINFFDTANVYGRGAAEGAAARGRRPGRGGGRGGGGGSGGAGARRRSGRRGGARRRGGAGATAGGRGAPPSERGRRRRGGKKTKRAPAIRDLRPALRA